LDLCLPGKTGLDILRDLRAGGYSAPIFLISGKGDIAAAVEAIKNGASDFIEKPFRGADVVARINDAAATRADRAALLDLPKRFPGFELLTEREIDVLRLCVRGASSKE